MFFCSCLAFPLKEMRDELLCYGGLWAAFSRCCYRLTIEGWTVEYLYRERIINKFIFFRQLSQGPRFKHLDRYLRIEAP
jgi:hypothetical protein